MPCHCLNISHAQFWFMGYRSQVRSSQSGRGSQKSQHEIKKARGQKHHSSGKYLLEEEHVLTPGEIGERRRKEASLEETAKSLFESKILLERIEGEYATRTRESEGRKNSEITRLQGNIAECRKELDDLAKVKAGLFRAMSKKAKKQKEAELTQRLNAAQSETELAKQNSAAEQESLRNDYEKRKQLVTEQIGKLQKEAEAPEVDGSLEARRAACEALANAVNAFIQRKAGSAS